MNIHRKIKEKELILEKPVVTLKSLNSVNIQSKKKDDIGNHIKLLIPQHHPCFPNEYLFTREKRHPGLFILRYKLSGNPAKNQRKTPRRNSPCKETRKCPYITRGNVFLPELNLKREDQCTQMQMAGLCQLTDK